MRETNEPDNRESSNGLGQLIYESRLNYAVIFRRVVILVMSLVVVFITLPPPWGYIPASDELWTSRQGYLMTGILLAGFSTSALVFFNSLRVALFKRSQFKLYENGIVIHDENGEKRWYWKQFNDYTIRWSVTTDRTNRITLMFMGKTMFAVNNETVFTLYPAHRNAQRIAEFMIDRIAPYIARSHFKRIGKGETISYGPIELNRAGLFFGKIDRAGLFVGKEKFSWKELERVERKKTTGKIIGGLIFHIHGRKKPIWQRYDGMLVSEVCQIVAMQIVKRMESRQQSAP